MRFEFTTAARVVFGPGTLREVFPFAATLGQRALLVTGRSTERARPLAEGLNRAGISHFPFAVPSEPTTDLVVAGIETARRESCDFVVAFGGGSAIDAAKAIAAMLGNPGELLDYLEVVGRGQPIPNPAWPWIAIPTTAGTGAEVTRNAVLASPAHKVKAASAARCCCPGWPWWIRN